MAKQIRWTERAIFDRSNIYQYWLERNRSSSYPDKLEQLFERSAKTIAMFPQIGTKTDYRNVYSKLVQDYKIFYRIQPTEIQILRIWDTRRHPRTRGL